MEEVSIAPPPSEGGDDAAEEEEMGMRDADSMSAAEEMGGGGGGMERGDGEEAEELAASIEGKGTMVGGGVRDSVGGDGGGMGGRTRGAGINADGELEAEVMSEGRE